MMNLLGTTFVTALIALGTTAFAADTGSVTASTTGQEQHSLCVGDLEAFETWLFRTQAWITRAWQLATDVRAIYKTTVPAEETFPSSRAPLETKQAIHDLFAQTTGIMEDWTALSEDLATQVAVNPTDPYLLSLNQLLSSQVSTMNALSRMLQPVVFEESLNTVEFELTADIAKLWQTIGAMLLRQLREDGDPLFGQNL